MHGTFNGVELRQILWRKIVGTTSSFRVLDGGAKLEAQLRVGSQALLILSDEIIEGRIANVREDVQRGYEVTIEVPDGK